MFSVRVHLGAVAVAEQRLREDGFHNVWCEAGSVMTMVVIMAAKMMMTLMMTMMT